MLVLVRPAGDPEPVVLGPFAEAELEAIADRELRRLVALEGGSLPAGYQPSWAITNLIGSDYRVADLVSLEVPS